MIILNSLKKSWLIKATFLHQSKTNDWADAVYWLFWTLFGGLMPVWGGFLLLKLFSQNPTMQTFTQNGEFALYSTSTLAAAFYVISKESGLNLFRAPARENDVLGHIRVGFPGRRLLGTTIFVLTVVSAFLFTGAVYAQFPGVSLDLNNNLLHNATLSIFLITIFITFFITVIDNAWTRTDVPSMFGESYDKLEDQFDAYRMEGRE